MPLGIMDRTTDNLASFFSYFEGDVVGCGFERRLRRRSARLPNERAEIVRSSRICAGVVIDRSCEILRVQSALVKRGDCALSGQAKQVVASGEGVSSCRRAKPASTITIQCG